MDDDHLVPAARKTLSCDASDRIRWLNQPHWIGYDRARDALAAFDRLMQLPTKSRMPNMLLVGTSNNGKTVLLERFHKKHPPSDNPGGDHINCPVFLIQAPPKPSISWFYSEILDHLFVPFRHSDRVEKKQMQVVKVFRSIGVRLLMIDEVHHLLAGSPLKQREFLNVIKFLGNELQIPIIASGTEEALHAFGSDRQIASRFTPFELPRWKFDEEFLRLLLSIESLLPLPSPSDLHANDKLAKHILERSEGTIGEIYSLLSTSCERAIHENKDRLTFSFVRETHWASPSQRRRLYQDKSYAYR